jgi:phosphoglycolate phosphatase-like HAD superfamily hydrolase
MKLAIFDIDGTLTQTNDIDTQCYIKAFAEEFDITGINTNWSDYGHTTDSAISIQIFQDFWGHSPKEEELLKLKNRFVELLKSSYAVDNQMFLETPGIFNMLRKIAVEDWAIAFATGGWLDSASMKLEAIGLNFTKFPIASADDSISREEIVKTAISRAEEKYGVADFDKIVCIGDGIWDVLTAVQLQLPFVGVTSDRQVLQDAGVKQVITDFTDFDEFIEALNNASIPQQQYVQKSSLPASYFEALYTTDPDPWKFETSEYEIKKYQATLAALPKQYNNAFEIGGSIGVLTEQLADKCKSLLCVDASKIAQEQAIERCKHLSQVRFEVMCLPQQFPEEMFDLILVSEVGYYLSWEDLLTARQMILEHLQPGGHLLLVHWTLFAQDYPLNGNEVHDAFMEFTPDKLRHLKGQREEEYRLDLFERV